MGQPRYLMTAISFYFLFFIFYFSPPQWLIGGALSQGTAALLYDGDLLSLFIFIDYFLFFSSTVADRRRIVAGGSRATL